MKKKAIIGAGGFAREVKAAIGDPNIPFFVDEEYASAESNIYSLLTFDSDEYEVIIAIGDPTDRANMVKKLPTSTEYFTFIDPTAILIGTDITIGKGSIICAGSIITTNVTLGDHTHLNLLSTVGHDTKIGDYFTTAPGAKISGNCNIGDRVYLGTNSSIREKVNICDNVVVGLNAGVVKHISEEGTYVGVPAKRIK